MKNNSIEVQNISINDYILDSKNIQLISVYNSIDQVGYTMEMVYNDITNMKNLIPIKGGESVKMVFIDVFKTKVKKTFILRTIKELSDPELESRTIHMTFITEDAFHLGTDRVYSSYNTTVSNIIKKYIPQVQDENPTSENIQVLIPGFTKTKAIRYLRQFTDNYFLFENNTGFKYSNVEDLLITSPDIYKFESNNRKSRYFIIGSKEIQLFNTISETYDNIYNNIYKTYNPGTKTIDTKTSNIKDEQTVLKTLGSGENYSSDINGNLEPKITMFGYSENILKYSKIVDLMFNKKFEILLNGDLALEVGNTINLKTKDKFTNGLYLITKVAHHIDAKDFHTKLEVQKNALFKGDITSNVVI